jgi:5'-phosphate synthase pdxT subunit
VGVLALQGSFREHMALLRRVPGVEPVEVRTKEQLRSVAGLIIPGERGLGDGRIAPKFALPVRSRAAAAAAANAAPPPPRAAGGESTTMALVAEQWGLIPELRSFAGGGRPVWGTCAGLIFLADRATGQKEGGQALLGGLDCLVHRNFFGAQINSFEAALPAPGCLPRGAAGAADADAATFRAMFIRAPAITEVGPGVEVLAEYRLSDEERAAQGMASVIVAVRSGPLLATAFHPELTQDDRWHRLFVEMVRAREEEAAGDGAGVADAAEKLGRAPTRPADMPVYD